MKKAISFCLALYILCLSVFSASFSSSALTYQRSTFDEWFEEAYNDGSLDRLENMSYDVLSTFIFLATGVMISPSLIDDFLHVISSDIISLPYDNIDFDTFIQQNTTMNDTDKTVSLTGVGRRKMREAVSVTIKNYSDVIQYKSLPITSNMLYFSNSPSITSENLSYVMEFLNDYSTDYYIFVSGHSASSSSTFVSFLDTNQFYLVPKNFIPIFNSYTYTATQIQYYFNDGTQNINFYRLGFRVRPLNSETYYIYSVSLSSVLNAYTNGNELTLTSSTNSPYYYFPFNPYYGVLSLSKGYNNNNFPFISLNDANSSRPWIFISVDDVEVMTLYLTFNAYLASLTEPPSYFVGDSYYSYDYSSDNSSTIGTQTIYNNSPTYYDVQNFYGNYYAENSQFPTTTVIYNYINNYTAPNNGSGGGGSGGGDSGGGDSGGGIFDWLGSLGSVLGNLISGLGNLIVNLLDSITSVFGNLATVLPESMGSFFSTFFDWLPPEWVSLITLSLTLGVVFGLVKIIRG